MRRALQTSSIWLLLASAVTLAACGSNDPGVRPGGTSTDSTSGSTGTGGNGSETTGSGTTTADTSSTGTGGGPMAEEDPGIPMSPDACAESMPGQRLLRRLTARELLNTQAAVFPAAAPLAATELPPDLQGAVRLTNDAGTLMMGTQMTAAVTARAEEIASIVTTEPELSANLPCASQADAACATQFIDSYGSALFRRPLTDSERTRYLDLFTSVSGRSDFPTGLKWALVSLVQSPHSVYRSELGQGGQLTAYEIASELSYNYSANPPADELLALAESGGLLDPAVRVQEAQKLLASPAGEQVLQQFFSEWLWLSQVGSANRANAPQNFAAIRPKMILETQRFIQAVLFTHQGTLADLLTADYTVADADLAAYYGLAGGTGDLYTDGGVQVPRNQGLGIFAQGSVLTSMASVEITSPTRRGLLLLKRLFCEVPGAPEALSFDLTRTEVQGNTTRERLESSHLQGPCQACHAQFDPLGFAFENFDHVGRYRTEEVTANGSFPIDASVAVDKLGGQVVNGQEELMTLLSQDEGMLSCVSATLERYIYGSDGTCRAKHARASVMAGQSSVVGFLADLAAEPHFASRN